MINNFKIGQQFEINEGLPLFKIGEINDRLPVREENARFKQFCLLRANIQCLK